LDLKKAGIRQGELMNYISDNNLPVITVHGTFHYDFTKDIATCDRNQKEIYGFDNNVNSFKTVISLVHEKSKELFQEQSIGAIGKYDIFSTNQFQLQNGNIISEQYKFDYHPDDYERRSPIFMSGQTTLLRKVA
tara:strand:+ start:10331 stop:10732 length:402 start_codon:yes stop_codon:yes gene_type:complete